MSRASYTSNFNPTPDNTKSNNRQFNTPAASDRYGSSGAVTNPYKKNRTERPNPYHNRSTENNNHRGSIPYNSGRGSTGNAATGPSHQYASDLMLMDTEYTPPPVQNQFQNNRTYSTQNSHRGGSSNKRNQRQFGTAVELSVDCSSAGMNYMEPRSSTFSSTSQSTSYRSSVGSTAKATLGGSDDHSDSSSSSSDDDIIEFSVFGKKNKE